MGLLRSRREDVTLVLYINDRHRFVGHAVVAVGWVQAARLSVRPILAKSQACRATGFVLVRSRRWGAPGAGALPAPRNPRIAPSVPSLQRCGRHGLAVVDHLVVKATSDHDSALQGGTWRGVGQPDLRCRTISP